MYEEFSEILSEMYTSLHVKNWLFLSDLKEISIFSINVLKILRYQTSWKSVQWSWVVPCGRTDRQTDMMKLIVAFHNFANVPDYEGIHMCVCVCVWNKNHSHSTPGCHARQVGRHTPQWFWKLLVQSLKYKTQEAKSSSYTVARIPSTTINHIPEESSWNMEIISRTEPAFQLVSNYHKN